MEITPTYSKRYIYQKYNKYVECTKPLLVINHAKREKFTVDKFCDITCRPMFSAQKSRKIRNERIYQENSSQFSFW